MRLKINQFIEEKRKTAFLVLWVASLLLRWLTQNHSTPIADLAHLSMGELGLAVVSLLSTAYAVAGLFFVVIILLFSQTHINEKFQNDENHEEIIKLTKSKDALGVLRGYLITSNILAIIGWPLFHPLFAADDLVQYHMVVAGILLVYIVAVFVLINGLGERIQKLTQKLRVAKSGRILRQLQRSNEQL